MAGAVSYHIFRKKVGTNATDFVDSATVLVPTTSHTFTGADEDERDIFQVKAFKAADVLSDASNAVQDLFFPDRSAGVYTTNTSTPDGQPATVPVDVAYLTKDEFIKFPIARGLGFTMSSLCLSMWVVLAMPVIIFMVVF